MHDEQLRIFLNIAETGSFSKAGENSYLTKQAMLRQMNQLEAEAGFPLLERRRTGTVLTEPGKMFYEGIRRILDEKERLLEACRTKAGVKEVLRVGNVEHQALLTPVTNAFMAQCPQIRVQQVIHPNHSGEWRVENGIQDVAETFYSAFTRKGKFRYTPLTKVPYMAAMRRGHRLAGRRSVSIRDLIPFETMIFPIMLDPAYTEYIQNLFSSRKDHLICRDDVDNQVGAAYSCLETDRILITANPFIESITELVKVPLDTGWMREYGVICREPMTPAVRKYVDLAIRIYTEKSPEDS